MIPDEIDKEHILRAAREIDVSGVPVMRASRDYDVLIKEKLYPPKYIVSVAARLATGVELSAWSFITTEARHFLTKRGFTIRQKSVEVIEHKRYEPVADTISLTWRDAEANGYTDIFPLDLFSESVITDTIHKVVDPKGGAYEAKCHISSKKKIVLLDYEQFVTFNEARDVLLGVTRLTFADADRTSIELVEWKRKGDANFKVSPFSVSILLSPAVSKYQPSGKSGRKVRRLVRERPGQARFRKDLKFSYGNTCCISGCTVAEALDGAHIDPFRNATHDNPQNGLLLRRDIHALFDAHLIAIDAKTLLVHVAAEARVSPEYAQLHGKRKLGSPKEGGPSYAPSREALARHWAIFEKTQRKL